MYLVAQAKVCIFRYYNFSRNQNVDKMFISFLQLLNSQELNDDEKQMIMMFTEDCRKAHKISDKEIYDMMAGNVPDSQSAKCAVGCLMKQYKMVRQNSVELEQIKAKIF